MVAKSLPLRDGESTRKAFLKHVQDWAMRYDQGVAPRPRVSYLPCYQSFFASHSWGLTIYAGRSIATPSIHILHGELIQQARLTDAGPPSHLEGTLMYSYLPIKGRRERNLADSDAFAPLKHLFLEDQMPPRIIPRLHHVPPEAYDADLSQGTKAYLLHISQASSLSQLISETVAFGLALNQTLVLLDGRVLPGQY